MTRRFFFGESAVDSIRKVAKNVDQQLLTKARSYGLPSARYEPWMAIPRELLLIDKAPNWSDSLFFSRNDLAEFRALIGKLNPEKDQIFSLENYPIKISDLSLDELDEFKERILSAKAALEEKIHWIRPLYDTLIHKIIPIEGVNKDDDNDYGMSTVWLKGVIFYDRRQHKSFDLRVENVAHELAHQIIINYQLSDRIIASDFNAPVYSGIRRTNRPAIMAFHGAAALTYMLLAAKAFNASKRIEEIRTALKDTLHGLESVSLTPLGDFLVREMHETLE